MFGSCVRRGSGNFSLMVGASWVCCSVPANSVWMSPLINLFWQLLCLYRMRMALRKVGTNQRNGN